MKKKILAIVLALMTVLVVGAFSVSADENSGPEANRDGFAMVAPGGEVNSVDELVAALGYAQKVDGQENTVFLTESIVLKTPVVINTGRYTLLGGNCKIYRGSDFEALFVLNGAKLGNKPSLTMVSVTVDGMSDKYKADNGLISVLGAATFKAEEAKFIYSESYGEYGGAISCKTMKLDDEQNMPLAPEVALENCSFTYCKAYSGGAIGMSSASGNTDGKISVKNCIFEYNSTIESESYGRGGAIYCEVGNVSAESSQFKYNKADMGGAVYSNMHAVFKNSNFEGNTANVNGGAAVALVGGEINNSGFIGNSAQGNGGAIFGGGVIEIDGAYTYISENEAGNFGGGIYVEGECNIAEGAVSLNKAGKLGGGIYLVGVNARFAMTNGELFGNMAPYCGAVWCDGEFNLLGGAIGNTNSEFPQIVVRGTVSVGKTAFIEDDVLGMVVKKNGDKSVYQPIKLIEEQTVTQPFNVSYIRLKYNKYGNVDGFSNVTKSKIPLFEGAPQAIKKATELFAVKSRGLLSYKINDDGLTSVRFIFLPIWVWVIIAALVLGGVGYVFRRRIARCYKKLLKKKKA